MTEYYIRRLLNGSYDVAKFEGADIPAALYSVSIRKPRPVCSCPGFRKQPHCKHVRMVEAFINRGEQNPLVLVGDTL